MGIPLATGRGFTTDDRADGLKVAIVNETMARMYWPGENPIGRRLALDLETLRFFPDRPPERNIPGGMREIVGVVKDIRSSSLQTQPVPEMYTPYMQRSVTDMTFVAQNRRRPAGARRAGPGADPVDRSQPARRSHRDRVEPAGLVHRSTSRALGAPLRFCAVALTLAMIGVFGLLAYDVAQRTPELGIRLALGGQPRDLRALILKNGLTARRRRTAPGHARGNPRRHVAAERAVSSLAGRSR